MKKIVIVLFSLLLVGCGSYDPYELPEDLNVDVNNLSYEVYEDGHKLSELITKTNGEIKTKDKDLINDKIGEYTETILIKYKKRTYKVDVKYNVVDTIPPVFISAATSRTIAVNDDYYPCDEIVFGDIYDEAPSCEINGVIDLTTVGTYKVKYVISDSSGNKNEKNLNVNVVESINNNSSSNNSTHETLPIANVIASKKTDNTEIGIDVSKWQGEIDFNKVRDSGVSFVIMRIGVNSDIDKDLSVDSYYQDNIKKAREAGLKVGVYVYTSAIDNKTAIEHAKWVLDTLNGEELDFPIAYDWENWSKFRKYGISIHDLDDAFNSFASTVEDAGYDAMLYSSKFYLENVWINKNNRPVWLAHYTSDTNYNGDYFLWQRANIGRVDGINGDVDIDILYKDKIKK